MAIARWVRSVSERLAHTRARQQTLRLERRDARDALKGLMQTLLSDLGALGEHTDRFHQHLGRYGGRHQSTTHEAAAHQNRQRTCDGRLRPGG